MKRSTKGALAAAAAAVLLLGGAGTLAYWTSTDDAEGGAINAGSLALTSNDDCTDWVYTAGAAGAGDPVVTFVPGDQVTATCTFDIVAAGDNLAATISAPADLEFTTAPAAASFTATVAASYDVDDDADPATAGTVIADGDTITEANDGDTLTVVFDVELPFGTDETGTPAVNANDTSGIVATLDTLTVTLTQADPNP